LRKTWAVVFWGGVGAGVLAKESLFFGVPALISVPFLIAGLRKKMSLGIRKKYETSSLLYFHAVRGLVRSGLGLPAALFQVANTQPGVFHQSMAFSLAGFDQGNALADCLEQLNRRFPSPFVRHALRSLQMAYDQGLPVSPLLDRIVPLLEKEQARAARARDLRQLAYVQGGLAFCLPWVLLGTLAAFQPELSSRLWQDSGTAYLLSGVFAVEGVGVWCLQRASSFC
jgi:Flp pilus assembly protein TadB